MKKIIEDTTSRFFSRFPQKSYAPHEVIVHAGDDPPGVMYLCSGAVVQYDITESGGKVVVNIYKPGAFFPMSWAINSTSNNYYFEAHGDVQIRVAPSEEVVSFVKKHPEVLYDLLSRVYRGLDGVLTKIVQQMSGNARTKLLNCLLIRAKRFGAVDVNGHIHVSVTEHELADETGLTRETVSREMSKLRKAKLVQNSKGRIIIPDTNLLETQV